MKFYKLFTILLILLPAFYFPCTLWSIFLLRSITSITLQNPNANPNAIRPKCGYGYAYNSARLEKELELYVVKKTKPFFEKKYSQLISILLLHAVFSWIYSNSKKKIWLGINPFNANVSVMFHTFCILLVQIQHNAISDKHLRGKI